MSAAPEFDSTDIEYWIARSEAAELARDELSAQLRVKERYIAFLLEKRGADPILNHRCPRSEKAEAEAAKLKDCGRRPEDRHCICCLACLWQINDEWKAEVDRLRGGQ